jgi:2'-5' RNA ligase
MNLYYLAVLPSTRVSEQVTALKMFASANFQTHHALRSPPHVTLIPPLHLGEAQLISLRQDLHSVAAQTRPFFLHFPGFGRFEERVIFLRVAPCVPLVTLQLALRDLMPPRKSTSRPFHPHMTIAHRDIAPDVFSSAFLHFALNGFSEYSLISSFALLKLVNHQWVVSAVFPFGNRDAGL